MAFSSNRIYRMLRVHGGTRLGMDRVTSRAFAGADADSLVESRDVDIAIAVLPVAGASTGYNRAQDILHLFITNNDGNPQSRAKLDCVLNATIDIRRTGV
jgi:hypothetical protein